jgi:hypothetical protein
LGRKRACVQVFQIPESPVLELIHSAPSLSFLSQGRAPLLLPAPHKRPHSLSRGESPYTAQAKGPAGGEGELKGSLPVLLDGKRETLGTSHPSPRDISP